MHNLLKVCFISFENVTTTFGKFSGHRKKFDSFPKKFVTQLGDEFSIRTSNEKINLFLKR